MNPRDAILPAVRAKLPSGQHDRPDLPAFPVAEPDGRVASFARNLKQMGGQVVDHDGNVDPLAALRDRLSGARIVCSATPEVTGNRALAAVAHPKDLADVDVAAVRATFAVAETGSVLFTEAELQDNALVLQPRLRVIGVRRRHRMTAASEIEGWSARLAEVSKS